MTLVRLEAEGDQRHWRPLRWKMIWQKHGLRKIILAAVLDVLELADPGDICMEGVELNQAWADEGWMWNGGSWTKTEMKGKRNILAEEKAQHVMDWLGYGKWKKEHLKLVPLGWLYGTEPCWLEEVKRLILLPLLLSLESPMPDSLYDPVMEMRGWLCKSTIRCWWKSLIGQPDI